MIRMKKLRSSGVHGVNEGYVAAGREFSAANERRAKDLEDAGLAYRLTVIDTKPMPPMVKPERAASNKAADAGPLDSHGGKTGEEPAAPSSLPDRPRRQRRSTGSKGGGLPL